MSKLLYRGHLVTLGITKEMTADEMLHRGTKWAETNARQAMAAKIAAFIADEVGVKAAVDPVSGDVTITCAVPLLLEAVPKGVAHTTIVFMEEAHAAQVSHAS